MFRPASDLRSWRHRAPAASNPPGARPGGPRRTLARRVAIALWCALGWVGHPFGTVQAPASGPVSCTAAEFHQFDFWIGDWDVFEAGAATPPARVIVDRILDGCVLREDYQGANGTRGLSFSIYDAPRRVWHQSWVTNRGQLLVIEGGLRGNEMILAGADRSKGPAGRVRGVWTPIGRNVREVAMTSADDGQTWTPWFDLMFRKKTPGVFLEDMSPKKTPGVIFRK